MKIKNSLLLQVLWLVFFMLSGVSPGFAELVIEKSTNGFDADVEPGPEIIVGTPVTWTYVVTNVDTTGRGPTIFNVNVSDSDASISITCSDGENAILPVGNSMTCTGTGVATLGQYTNTGTATGDGVQPASDDSHYVGIPAPTSSISLETLTNGSDSDTAPGETLSTGNPVSWTYEVTNTGSTDLTNVVVNDDQGVTVNCPGSALATGTNMTCSGSGVVIDGQYMNNATVTAVDPSGNQVSDSDPSHYLGFCQISVDIVKKTNGQYIAETPGPELAIGDPVTWTYEVTNTSACNLLNIVVTDDQEVAVSCPQTELVAGEQMVCSANGNATTLGQYTNVATVYAGDRLRNQIQAQDSSFYFGLAEGATLAAVAGPDQTVDEGTASVSLDGTGSINPVTFLWEQIAGPVVTNLTGVNTANPTFDAPYITGASTTITFRLTVTDGVQPPQNEGDPIPETASDTVDITVVGINTAPVADAGADFTAKLGQTAILDGSGSYDNESGDQINYFWAQVDGASVSLSDPTAMNPSFETIGVIGDSFVFQLIVDDGKESSIPQRTSPIPAAQDDDLVVVTVVDNSAPVANAGPDQTVDENSTVSLDGSFSHDPNGDILSYSWSQISGPSVSLDDSSIDKPSFQAPSVNPGDNVALVFELTVTDNDIINPLTDTDSVTINVVDVNDPPNCSLATANPASFWPPNHKMNAVSIDGVTDINGDEITITIDSITQDEPTNGLGQGDTHPDAIIPAENMPAMIRAERSGQGDGRVYTVNFTASDGYDSCSGSVQVSVPHSRKSTAVDSGENYDSTQ